MLIFFELLIIYGRKRQKRKIEELSQRVTEKHRGPQRIK
jgi:hypothetical protein